MASRQGTSVARAFNRIYREAKARKTVLLVLSCFVVFITTYMLILPAVTLDQEEAERQGGIDVTTEQETDITAEDSKVPEGPVASEDAAPAGAITFEGKGYQIQAECADANLPGDTEIVAEEIGKKDKDYEDLYADALEVLQQESQDNITDLAFAKFYDLSLISDGESLEPDDPINITISYDKALKVSDADNLRIVHFAVDKKTGEITPEVLDKDQISAEIKRDKMTAATFEAASFSVYGIVYTVDLEYDIDARGDTWEITVTYGEDAQIPDGAKLKVKGLLPKDKKYADLYDQSVAVGTKDAEERGVELPVVCSSRLFDIEIHGDDGEIEPAAPVQVNIRLAGNKEKTEQLSVVHFAEEGAEALDNQEVDTTAKDAYEVVFEAESFSVYTVQNITDLAGFLNDAKYALVSERGTGITSADNVNSVSNFAMISSLRDGTLSGKGVYMDKTVTPRTVGGHVTEWGFEDAGNNQYCIFMMDGETKKYVKADGSNLVMDSTGTAFTATVTNNKVRFSYNGRSITSTGDNPSRFVLENNNENASLFNLCEVELDYEEKTAKKVSAADWKSGNDETEWNENSTVVIYRRVEHEDGSEELYAIATDGSLIPVTDGGDSIYYHCPEGKNVNWHVALGASGYYISNVIPDGSTESTVYLAPSVTNGTWSSSSPVGLVLGGMGNEYGTSIENWDQAAYAYAGLHVDATNQAALDEGVTPGSGVTSDTFLFAVSDTLISEGKLHTVDTVDSTSKGITMKIFNYGGDTYHYGYRNTDMQSVMGDDMLSDWDNRKSHVTRTVEGKLGDDGFPVSLTSGYGSYKGLFTTEDEGGVAKSSSDANHLFLQTYYDEAGMFRYSSMENFAHFNENGDFTVYREAGTPNIPTANDHYYYYHGHFMPYNDLDPTVSVSRIVDQYGSMADKDMGRSFEDVYGLSETPDYYVGMTLDAKFVQPSGGTLENGDPVVYRFTGDDDLLVYIDGILVLDVGGIHEPLTGSINFATGTVYQPNFYGEGAGWGTHTTTLYEIFESAHDNGLISDEDWSKMKWADADGDGVYDTFAEHTTHSFNMFYFERGAGASNLDLQFNLQVVKKDEFTVRKILPENVKPEFVNQLYKFKAYFIDDTEPVSANRKKPLYPGATKADGTPVCTKVIYADLKDASGKPIEKAVPFDDADHSFTLRAGEAAVFSMDNEEIVYDVYEVDIDGNVIDKVVINGTSTQTDAETHEVNAGEATVEDRSEVNVTNHPITQNLRVTKHITEDSLSGWEEDNPVFEFRVYLEQFVTDENGDIVYENVIDEETGATVQKPKTKLVPYARSPYYLVKIPEGQENNEATWEYYALTGENNAPVLQPHGTVCSITGRSGTINSIPPEYTIIIPNLAVGTHFYVEERRVNIPDGYEFDHEKLKDGTYDPSTLGASKENIAQIMTIDQYSNNEEMYFDAESVGRIKKGSDAERTDAEFDVWNRKPAIEIPVKKEWVGGTTPRPDVTLALIRYMPQEKYTPPVGQGAIIIEHKADYGEHNDSTDLPSGFVATYTIEKYNTETEEYEVVAADTSGPFDVDPGMYRVITVVNNRGNEPANFTYDKTEPVTVEVHADQSTVAEITSEYNYEQGGQITIVHNAAYEGGELTGSDLPEGVSVTYTIKDEATNRIVHRNVQAGTYDVPAGKYTVTANVSDSAPPDSYVYDGTTTAKNVTVTSGGSANAQLTSSYVYVAPKTYGYITVSHESAGLTGTSPALPQNFQVASYRIVGPTTINNAQLGQEYEVEAGEYTVIANINYAPVVDGYVYAGTPAQEVVVGTDGHQSVKLTSTYGKQGAIHIVHKSEGISGTDALPAGMSVQYTIVNNATGETVRDNVAAGTYSVPAGEYTVSAHVYNPGTAPEGYYYLDTESATVTVIGEETVDANIVSRYGANGSITINHVSEGLKSSPDLASGSSVRYTIYDASGNPVQNCANVNAGTYSVAPGNYTVTSHYNYHPVPSGYEYLEEESTESVSVTVGSSQNATANLISKYQRIGGDNANVYLVVAYSPNKNGAPTLTVPTGSTLTLNYQSFYYAGWNNTISPNWELYYWNGDYWTKDNTQGGGVPDSDGVDINLGDESIYCVLINTDSGFSGEGQLNESLVLKQSSAPASANRQTASAPSTKSSPSLLRQFARFVKSGLRGTPSESNVDPSTLTIPSSITAPIDTLNQGLAGSAAGYEYTLDTAFGKQVVLSDPWTYTFDDLEEVGEGGHPYYYALVEVEKPDDYQVSYTNNPISASDIKTNMDDRAAANKHNQDHPDDPVAVPDLLTLTAINTSNNPSTGSLELTKEVAGTGADQNKEFTFTVDLTAPAGATLDESYQVLKTGEEETTLTLQRTEENTKASIQVTLKHGQSWEIKDLPVGTSYTITESDYSEDGYTQSVSGSSTGTIPIGVSKEEVKFTNTYSAVDVKIIKIDEGTRNADHQTLLPQAKFKLYKYTVPEGGSEGTYTVYPNESSCEKTTNANGELTFEKLPNGKYMIEESAAPDGYIKQEELKIYFTVSEGGTLTYTNEDGETIDHQNLVTYAPTNKAFTVGNISGAALPESGGPGTLWIYLLGSLLLIGCGTILIARRRTNVG